jgi:hypothetical protein
MNYSISELLTYNNISTSQLKALKKELRWSLGNPSKSKIKTAIAETIDNLNSENASLIDFCFASKLHELTIGDVVPEKLLKENDRVVLFKINLNDKLKELKLMVENGRLSNIVYPTI